MTHRWLLICHFFEGYIIHWGKGQKVNRGLRGAYFLLYPRGGEGRERVKGRELRSLQGGMR